jgi:hypothetical protein
MDSKGTDRRRRRAKTPTTSSSSETRERSKGVQAVLELGQHLVNELGLEDSTDTLGRWMAHHVAELMVRATEESEPDLQQKAQDRAVETILKIWERRKTLPRDADPLKRYEQVVDLFIKLETPPKRWWGRNRTSADTAYLELFSDLRRLVDTILTLQGCSPHFLKLGILEAVTPFQADSERELLKLFRKFTGESDLTSQGNPLNDLEAKFASAVDSASKVRALAEMIRIHLTALEPSPMGKDGPTSTKSG